MTKPLLSLGVALLAIAAVVPVAPGLAQARGQGAQGPPPVVSPEVSADRRITVRLYAPRAEAVRLDASDVPGVPFGAGAPMTKAENGIWQTTLGPVPAGAYRYAFVVDGVPTLDPRNPATSEANTNAWSLVYVAGSDLFDTKPVPRGAVAEVTYHSDSLGMFRRMHVYTPPGYEGNRDRYPVLYLLHGAGDVDESWSSVGRAGFILDNLIAAGKAKPMIVVMPAGHVNGAGGALGAPAPATPAAVIPQAGQPDAFTNDFVNDLMPYVEKNYRVLTDRNSRAIAGLSMGGSQTLNIAIPRLEKFAYVGVFSSGILGGGGRGAGRGDAAPATPAPPFGEAWEKANLAALDNAAAKRGLRLFWFSTGKEDGLITTTKNTVDLLKKHGFAPVFLESEGAHTWLNWRDYLTQFTPQLFQAAQKSTQ